LGVTDLINIFWLSIYLFTFKTHLKRSYGRFIQSFEYYTHRIFGASFVWCKKIQELMRELGERRRR